MTSINTRPAPYTVGYEQPEKTAPIRGEESREASQQAGMSPDTAPPRSPVRPEQRGQFSSHSKIVNQQPQGADVKGEIAELTEKNNALSTKIDGLEKKYGPVINRLYQEILGMTAQFNGSSTATNDASNPQAQGRGSDSQNVAPPETSPNQDAVSTPQSADAQVPADVQPPADPATTPDATATQPGQPAGLDALNQATTQLGKKLEDTFKLFQSAFAEVIKAINNLAAQIHAMNNPQNQSPSTLADSTDSALPDSTDSASPDSAPPETQTSSPTEQSAQVNAPTAEEIHDLAGLKNKHAKLEVQLVEAERNFVDTISMLQKQFNDLAQHLPKKG